MKLWFLPTHWVVGIYYDEFYETIKVCPLPMIVLEIDL